MKTLSLLFGSEARVKIIRLFIFNAESVFDIEMICQKSKINSKIAKKELNILEKADLIKKKIFYKIITKNKKTKIIETKKRSQGYCLNDGFSYMAPLRQLLINTKALEDTKIIKDISMAGKPKLIIVSGIFIQDREGRLDMLIVGNNLKQSILNGIIKNIEAETGTDIVYAYFETPDFEYRLSMNDKLIRDVLDYPHKVLLDRMNN